MKRRGAPALWGVGLLLLGALLPQPSHADSFQVPLVYLLSIPVQRDVAGFSGQVQLPAGEEGDQIILALNGRLVSVAWQQAGRQQVLADLRWPEGPSQGELHVYRDTYRLALLWEGRWVGEVAVPAGRAGEGQWLPGQGVQAAVRVQPIEPPYFSDDFMRTQEQSGGWEVVEGQWSLTGPKSPRPNPQLSANPFTYRAEGTARALSVVGFPFWRERRFTLAVKPEQWGTIGAALVYHGPDHACFFQWTTTSSGQGVVEWVVRTQGRQERLAQAPRAFEPGVWYLLELRLAGQEIQALIDGELILQARLFGPLEGRIGLLAEGGAAVFDDVTVTAWFGQKDDPEQAGLNWWPLQGEWSVDKGRLAASAAGDPTGAAAVIAGEPWWGDCTLGVDVYPKQGTSGVALCAEDAQHGYVVALAPGDPATLTLEWRTGEQGQRLGEVRYPYPFESRQRWRISLYQGRLMVTVGDRCLLDVVDHQGEAGHVVLFTQGQAAFRNVVMWAYPPPARATLAEQFTKEPTMAGWASPQGAWFPPSEAGGNYHWHRGWFFADWEIQFDIPARQDGRWEWLLANQPQPGAGLLQVVVENKPEEAALRARIVPGTEVTWEPSDDPLRLRLERRGQQVVLSEVEGRILLRALLPHPDARWLGMKTEAWPIPWPSLQVSADQLEDDPFSRAPTEWYADRGRWEVMDRWKCYPGWSWFGGSQDEAPVLWSKRVFEGDILVEAYAAIQMDQDGGYSHPSDLNVALFGDGRTVGTGYNFIFGGWGNTRSGLWRIDRLVVQNDQVKMENPTGGNTEGFHRHWFYLRVERRGARLRYWVDDRLVAEYEDPAPLKGGRVGFWTYRNGILLARVRIWSQKGGRVEPPPTLPVAASGEPPAPTVRLWSPTHFPLAQTFEQGIGEVRAMDPQGVRLAWALKEGINGSAALQAVNHRAGGSMAVRLIGQAFDVRQAPRLSFDIRLSPNLGLNLYFRVGDRWHTLVMTGPEQAREGGQLLGKVEGVAADGKWHYVALPLDTLLAPCFAQGAPWRVEEVVLAREGSQEYQAVGIGGTPWGCSFYLDNLKLEAKGGRTLLLCWQSPAGVPYEGYASALDQRPDTEPRGRPQAETWLLAEGLKPGRWYFHLTSYPYRGDKPSTQHWPIDIVAEENALPTEGLRGFYPTGLVATLFDDPDLVPPGPHFTQKVATRTDTRLDFTWAEGSQPVGGVGPYDWSATWEGSVRVPRDGDYRFFVENLDDGARLYVDGKRAIDAWLLQPPLDYASEPLTLKAGDHTLRLEYHQGPGAASVRVGWEGPGWQKEVIPRWVDGNEGDPARRGVLGDGWQATFYEDPDHQAKLTANMPVPGPTFQKEMLRRVDSRIDFTWDKGQPPLPGMGAHCWSIRWEGQLLVPRAEAYTFFIENLDDAGRLFIDDQPVIDSWLVQPASDHASQPVQLEAGLHRIRLEYHQLWPLAGSIRLAWSSPSIPKEVIPACYPPP